MKNTSSVIDMSVYDMSVVVVNNKLPRSRFQLQAITMLNDGLNGLAYRTEDVDILRTDIVEVLKRIEKLCEHDGYHLVTKTSLCTKLCAKDAQNAFKISLAESFGKALTIPTVSRSMTMCLPSSLLYPCRVYSCAARRSLRTCSQPALTIAVARMSITRR